MGALAMESLPVKAIVGSIPAGSEKPSCGKEQEVQGLRWEPA